MVRLVFRPYTQIWRSICTLESLRASTRFSPGFTLHRHSSPSFGSQQICSHSNLSSETHDRSMVQLAPPTTFLSVRTRVYRPSTRIYVRLLGPCFKTGRWDPFRQHPETFSLSLVQSTTKRLKKEDSKRLSSTSLLASSFGLNWCWQVLNPIASLSAISSPFNSLFKVLFIFPSRYLFAIGLLLLFSFRWNLPPN